MNIYFKYFLFISLLVIVIFVVSSCFIKYESLIKKKLIMTAKQQTLFIEPVTTKVLICDIEGQFSLSISIGALLSQIEVVNNKKFYYMVSNYYRVNSFEFHNSTKLLVLLVTLKPIHYEKRYDIHKKTGMFPSTEFQFQFK